MPKYEARKVKTFQGREGQGYNAELWEDGQRVATVIDSGNGGCPMFNWMDHAEGAAQRRFEEHAKSLPPLKIEGWGKPLDMHADLLMGELVEDALALAKLKRAMKKYLCCIKPGEDWKKGWTQYRAPYTPALAAQVRAKTPGIIILNETMA